MKSGLATAPTLFACQEYPQLEAYIARKFENEGDIETVLELVQKSNGLHRTKQLAQVHVENAISVVMEAFPPSKARDALVALAVKIITRTH